MLMLIQNDLLNGRWGEEIDNCGQTLVAGSGKRVCNSPVGREGTLRCVARELSYFKPLPPPFHCRLSL